MTGAVCRQLGDMAEPCTVPGCGLHYVYPYPSCGRESFRSWPTGKVLPYLDVPFQHSATPMCCKRMKRPASGERNLERIAALARGCAPRS